jgi:hypothetical protein
MEEVKELISNARSQADSSAVAWIPFCKLYHTCCALDGPVAMVTSVCAKRAGPEARRVRVAKVLMRVLYEVVQSNT